MPERYEIDRVVYDAGITKMKSSKSKTKAKKERDGKGGKDRGGKDGAKGLFKKKHHRRQHSEDASRDRMEFHDLSAFESYKSVLQFDEEIADSDNPSLSPENARSTPDDTKQPEVDDVENYQQVAIIARAQALWDFIPSECQASDKIDDVELLSLKKGDIVEVLEADPSGWWIGVCGAEQGAFPGRYVEVFGEVEMQEEGVKRYADIVSGALDGNGDEHLNSAVAGAVAGAVAVAAEIDLEGDTPKKEREEEEDAALGDGQCDDDIVKNLKGSRGVEENLPLPTPEVSQRGIVLVDKDDMRPPPIPERDTDERDVDDRDPEESAGYLYEVSGEMEHTSGKNNVGVERGGQEEEEERQYVHSEEEGKHEKGESESEKNERAESQDAESRVEEGGAERDSLSDVADGVCKKDITFPPASVQGDNQDDDCTQQVGEGQAVEMARGHKKGKDSGDSVPGTPDPHRRKERLREVAWQLREQILLLESDLKAQKKVLCILGYYSSFIITERDTHSNRHLLFVCMYICMYICMY